MIRETDVGRWVRNPPNRPWHIDTGLRYTLCGRMLIDLVPDLEFEAEAESRDACYYCLVAERRVYDRRS